MKPKVDPIQEGPETEAFWYMVATAEAAVEGLQRTGAEPPERFKQVMRGRYRLSYLCGHCPDEHRVEGTWPQICSGFQLLLLQGSKSVLVETLEYALACDAEEADAMVEAAPEDGASINQRLHDTFFKRKP